MIIVKLDVFDDSKSYLYSYDQIFFKR